MGVSFAMKTIISQLEEKEILSSLQVKRIREYINKKHRKSSPKDIAVIFSNTIHKILDEELSLFVGNNLEGIKKNILIEATKRKELYLSGLDIFNGVISIDEKGEKEVRLLEEWILKNIQNVEGVNISQAINGYLYPELVQDKTIDLPELVELPTVSSYRLQAKRRPKRLAIALVAILVFGTSVVFAAKNQEIKTRNIEDYIIESSQGLNEEDFNEEKLNRILQARLNLEDEEVEEEIVIEKEEIIIENKEPEIKKDEIIDKAIIEEFVEEEVVEEIVKDQVESIRNNIVATSRYEGSDTALEYKEISVELLRSWLVKRGSILAEDDYFFPILDTAREYNLNPLLLFAITGQEQSFVPMKKSNASNVANNPFNVYGSWQKYNTDIYDATAIAARTLINLSKDRPSDVDPIKWINRKYAEDKNWWKGVSRHLKELEKINEDF